MKNLELIILRTGSHLSCASFTVFIAFWLLFCTCIKWSKTKEHGQDKRLLCRCTTNFSAILSADSLICLSAYRVVIRLCQKQLGGPHSNFNEALKLLAGLGNREGPHGNLTHFTSSQNSFHRPKARCDSQVGDVTPTQVSARRLDVGLFTTHNFQNPDTRELPDVTWTHKSSREAPQLISAVWARYGAATIQKHEESEETELQHQGQTFQSSYIHWQVNYVTTRLLIDKIWVFPVVLFR